MPRALCRPVSVCLAAVSFLALAGVSESPAGQVKKDKVKPDLVVPKEPPVGGLKDGTFVKPAVSTAPTSYFYAVSSAKDEFIGQGETIAYDGDKLRVMEVKGGTKIRLGVAKKSDWELIVAPPVGGTLKIGEYLDAKLYPDNGKAPGLEFKGMNRESAKVAGKFVVWEYEAAKGVVTKLAIDFIQRSEETGPPLYGVVRYNSSFK
ncbi:Uncharacterized protein OS=Shewanella xiamenensis GN=SXM_3719 PE=4 SV=1 [Gemmataceae bacterium]|nr:Uncharacterized protein OS=Shewanella xiamenensis GN=SXM_3719 PE=4 SV=1 [Gemmataceae bacterium]VTT98428.1 Uncharacterized protein OS=Shewanella xiamenensis GN=SXM_3719 PE=4 SV=1 [Gemmataceae bacterium]